MSHTYKNLKEKVTPTDVVRSCAKRVPLVHSIRNHVSYDEIIEYLKTGSFGLVTSRKSTQTANNLLGIPADSMFFYAGRAIPEQGIQVVLLFGGLFDAKKAIDETIETMIQSKNLHSMDCGARPFDSGGLATKQPDKKLRFSSELSMTEGQIKAYFADHNIKALGDWRDYFCLFLTEFFNAPVNYWDGIPKKPIDNVTFTKGDSWRNWTFELHSKWEVPPDIAGEMIVGSQFEHHLQHQIGFGDYTQLAPTVKKVVRFHHAPRKEAERKSREVTIVA